MYDYRPIFLALEEKLDEVQLEFKPGAACCVVLASRGYPGGYKDSLGLEICGIDEANSMPGVKVFHAGTKRERRRVFTTGGRVLGVTAYSPEGIRKAQTLSYQAVDKIKVDGGFNYRNDIAQKALGK